MAGSEEARSFVASHSRSFLLTRRDSGAPTGHPMTLRVSSAGDLLFNTYRASAKARNLIRRPQVSCLVTTGTDDPDPRWVLVSGTAEVLDRDEGIRAWSTSTGGPAVAVRSPVVGDTVQARLADGKRIVVRLRPERVIGPIRPARGS
ncbi:MAG TPA: pyridoxamine 5'-phosphate oxidase family protein [Acidimicrobiales bacterium]|jgi:PPOX class probable F420-dependent enzyme